MIIKRGAATISGVLILMCLFFGCAKKVEYTRILPTHSGPNYVERTIQSGSQLTTTRYKFNYTDGNLVEITGNEIVGVNMPMSVYLTNGYFSTLYRTYTDSATGRQLREEWGGVNRNKTGQIDTASYFDRNIDSGTYRWEKCSFTYTSGKIAEILVTDYGNGKFFESTASIIPVYDGENIVKLLVRDNVTSALIDSVTYYPNMLGANNYASDACNWMFNFLTSRSSMPLIYTLPFYMNPNVVDSVSWPKAHLSQAYRNDISEGRIVSIVNADTPSVGVRYWY